MAYGRFRRRRYSRKRKTLSNYNIATKTSAKAQSRQIYAIKRRINYIQRLTKPEINISQRLAVANSTSSTPVLSFSASARGISPVYWSLPGVFTPSSYVDVRTSGNSTVQGQDAINRFFRINSFSMFGNLQYTSPSTSVKPFTLRVVIVQSRATRSDIIEAQDVFSNVVSSDTSRSVAVFGPLQTGLSRTAKVLSDKRYVLSYQRPSINLKTILKRVYNYYFDRSSADSRTDVSEDIPKGAIFVFLAWYSLGDPQDIQLTLNSKMAYTDA